MSKAKSVNTIDNKSNSVWFLTIGVALVTIYINTKAYDPFNTPKLILVLLVSGWLFGHLVNSYRQDPIILKNHSTFSLVVIVAFLSTLLISTLLTDIKVVGFIGETQRRNGFLQYFALAIILLYAARSISFEFSYRIFKVAIFTGLFLSSYGVMQIFGNDFIKWDNPYNSMISTLGNPNFASSLLAILALLSFFGLFIKNISYFYKILSILVVILSTFAIIKSQSRQGLLVIFFSISIYSSIFFLLKRRKLGVFVVIITSLLSSLFILGMLQKGPLASILYKDSVSVRGYYWRAGIAMVKEYPLTGVGIDRYGAYFKEFREAAYPLKYGFDLTSTNAHNVVIQLFATGGLLVGACYLILLIFILISGIKLVIHSNGEHLKISLALLSTWIGFQAQSFISIDNLGVSVWGWLLGGAILGLAFNLEPKKPLDVLTTEKIKRRNSVKINLFQPSISFIALIPILIITTMLTRSESNTLLVRNLANPRITENNTTAFNYANEVIRNPLADPSYKYKVSLLISDIGYIDQATSEIEKLSNYDPRNLDYLQGLILIARRENNLEKAIDARKLISKYDPWNAQNYLELCKLYKFSNNLVAATEMKDKIFSFAPNSEEAKNAIKELA